MPEDDAQTYDQWADIYDRVYAYLDYDLGFYVAQASRLNGPVLELGCGTGRISLALAEAGIEVTGVDISPRMVEKASAKAKERGLDGKAKFIVGDMADVEAGGNYSMVCFPFRSFQSMLTPEEQREALENAAAHLRDGGILAIDVFAPDLTQLSDPRDEAVPFHIRDVEQEDGGTIVVWGQNMWDPVSQVNSARIILEEIDHSGLMQRRIYRDFDLRYTFRYEMEHLLELAGFDVEATYGDFEGGEVTEQSDDIVIVARKTS